MSGFEDSRRAIEDRFKQNWTTTPIKFENAPFLEIRSAYVAIFIREGDGSQISLGTVALRRWPGVIVFQIFIPQETGTKAAKAYADTIGGIFDRAQFFYGNSGIIRCRVPSASSSSVRDGWYQLNVSVPYIRDRQY